MSASRPDYSSEYINKELETAEKALAALQQQPSTQTSITDRALPPAVRLQRLTAETEDLSLLHAVTEWSNQRCNYEEEQDEDSNPNDNLLRLTDDCVQLGQILQQRTNVVSQLFQTLYQREYTPLYTYLSQRLVRQLRQALPQVGYPHKLSSQWEASPDMVGPYLHAWQTLDQAHRNTVIHVQGTAPPPTPDHPLVVELVRPLVTRVRFHFLQHDPKRPTSTRLDRLPEWLFRYIKHQFFGEQGPWHVIYYHWRPLCANNVLNEIIRLVQFVLQERQFFQKTTDHSILCRAVEEILQFDAFLQSWKAADNVDDAHNASAVISLTDCLVAGDEELLQWWLAVERDSMLGRLHQPTTTASDMIHMAPHAEVFGAMIRSIRAKAALFTSHAYVQHVAGPLCLQFLDAVHATATDLKEQFVKLIGSSRHVPSTAALTENLQAWMALLNGTHWCALILKGQWREDDQVSVEENDDAPSGITDESVISPPVDDLYRFGESLERLEQALLADLMEKLVGETLLLQKAKLANYLVQVPHILTGYVPAQAIAPGDLSVGLLETRQVLSGLVLETCVVPHHGPEHGRYAAEAISQGILEWTSHKFLEALLDESVQQILAVGGQVVDKDVQLLLGGFTELPPLAMRLLEVTRALQDVHLASIGDALCGLAGQAPPLTVDLFECDERLYEEAVSMMRAKEWLWCELPDILSVLNRRQDLSQPVVL